MALTQKKKRKKKKGWLLHIRPRENQSRLKPEKKRDLKKGERDFYVKRGFERLHYILDEGTCEKNTECAYFKYFKWKTAIFNLWVKSCIKKETIIVY